ncbi:DUF4266 domain-containing protein [Duganella callida]|uniref:DUF4266 domain-containing protein n=1 Tax=Duganella callida TaxID=2561932 RepID=A0A4Y9T0W9_9BURK|nr:DUF4266 domain-containing protein [Duganella callida]TFW30646.1 DUF4266 domain-containing protein [Duganella callida]
MKPLLTLVLVAGLAGCANVQPWEKGNLAKPEMTFNDGGTFARYDDHIYTSKENARGGAGVGGGGCGCN